LKTILSKKDILVLIHQTPPLVKDFIKLEDQLQPNGFDLTIRDIASIQSQGKIGVNNTLRALSDLNPISFKAEEFLFLALGSYLITYNEIIHLPRKVMALGAPRSSLLRCGVTVHMAVWDAGYSGRSQSLLTVFNPMGFQIQKNSRVAQLVFMELADETEAYNGAYQGENIK
jgi:dUTP pyrophosphatase